MFGCSGGKPKSSIKIQNPNFQFQLQNFFKNQYRLKKWPNACFFDPCYRIFHRGPLELDFSVFWKKSAFLKGFVGICTSNILGTTEVSNPLIPKNNFTVFQICSSRYFFILWSLESDKNSLRSSLRKKISEFFDLWVYFLTKYFTTHYSGFCEGAKISEKYFFFQKSIFWAERVGRLIKRWKQTIRTQMISQIADMTIFWAEPLTYVISAYLQSSTRME